MASAFKDSSGWIADFRPPAISGRKRRRVRIPAAQLAAGDPAQAARAYAHELERYARLVDGTPTDDQLAHAAAIGAVTPEEAAALRQGLPAPPPLKFDRPTLLDAADAHPSTRREMRASPPDYDRHMSALKEFVAWSRLAYVDEIRLDHVQRYIDYMRDVLDLEYPSRRHRLLYLRRACRMGAAQWGLPDPLAGFVLDRDESPAVVEAWTSAELCRAAITLEASGDRRALAALALGGFAGLRPSEMIRAQVGDFDAAAGVLHVGRRKRKNAPSQRTLPLAPIAAAWLKSWCEGKSLTRPILAPDKRIKRSPEAEYDHREISQWLAPILAQATARALEVKCLRKSFATWAISLGCSPNLVDEYLGHKVASVSAITARHYLAAARLPELRKIATAINKNARAVLRDLST